MQKLTAGMVALCLVLVAGTAMVLDARTVSPKGQVASEEWTESSPVTPEVPAPAEDSTTVQFVPTATIVEEVNPALAKLRERTEAQPPTPAPSRVELPIRLRIPALGVDADVEYVGLNSDGAMDVPKSPYNVAWYELGPRPGERGNAVVAGHVDWGQKAAVFWGLRELTAGDIVEVVAADETRYEFVVDSKQWYEAESAPVEEVFGQRDVPEITLITCGGRFDQSTKQYLSRLVVRAVLSGS